MTFSFESLPYFEKYYTWHIQSNVASPLTNPGQNPSGQTPP